MFKRLKAVGIAICALALAAGAAAAKDDLTLGMVLEPPHLDPTAGAAAAIDEVVYANLFEGLTRVDGSGVVKPALASSWEISDDGKTYTFTLREGVTFHDGTTMDSGDVAFSLNRIVAEDSVNAKKKNYAMIDNAKADGPNKVVVTLKEPTGDFVFRLGIGDAVILGEESAETNKSNPIGTGPLKFKRWIKGDRIELEENTDYWGEPIALKKATFKIIPDPAAAVAALMAGDVDAFGNFPAPESLAQFEADPRFTVKIGSTEGETILSINNAKEPFNDVRVRRAIAHALDRQAIVDGAMFGYGTVIGTHFAPHNPAYVDHTGLYPRDLDKAKALLAEAGHPNGFTATLKLPPPTYARRGGEIIAGQLREIGIELELIPVEWAQWLEQVFRGKDFDLTIVSHTEANDIPIYSWEGYYFNYNNDDFNALMEELNTTADPDKRNDIYAQAQKMIAEDAVNGFLFQLAKHGVWKKEVQGLWENYPIQANDLTGASWAK